MLRLSRNVGIKSPFFARSFAKAVPLKLGTPSGKCAHAIVDAAKAKKVNLKTVLSNLTAWMNSKGDSKEIQMQISNPLTSTEQKAAWFKKSIAPVLKKNKFDPLSSRLLEELMLAPSSAPLNYEGLADIKEDLQKLTDEALNEVTVTITSVTRLQEKQVDRVIKSLGELIAGKKPNVETKIDKTILGGLIVRVGGKQQDLSAQKAIMHVASKMRTMAV